MPPPRSLIQGDEFVPWFERDLGSLVQIGVLLAGDGKFKDDFFKPATKLEDFEEHPDFGVLYGRGRSTVSEAQAGELRNAFERLASQQSDDAKNYAGFGLDILGRYQREPLLNEVLYNGHQHPYTVELQVAK